MTGVDPSGPFVPPREAASAAERGLAMRDRFGRGGTAVGAERARRFAALEPLGYDEVGVVSAWFARHGAARRSAKRAWGDDSDPSAGWIAWNLWGGDAARAWADAIVGRRASTPEDPPEDPVVRRLRELCLV